MVEWYCFSLYVCALCSKEIAQSLSTRNGTINACIHAYLHGTGYKQHGIDSDNESDGDSGIVNLAALQLPGL